LNSADTRWITCCREGRTDHKTANKIQKSQNRQQDPKGKEEMKSLGVWGWGAGAEGSVFVLFGRLAMSQLFPY
jgi:hypothetical protein